MNSLVTYYLACDQALSLSKQSQMQKEERDDLGHYCDMIGQAVGNVGKGSCTPEEPVRPC